MNSAEKVLSEIEKVARQAQLPIIGRERGAVLEEIVKERQPQIVLEIGTNVGYSTILIAKNLGKGRVISIELGKNNWQAAKANIERAGLAKKTELLQGDALEIIPSLDGPFDMIFIDAKKEDYLKYLKAAEPKMAKNAVVVADNVGRFKAEVKEFLQYVRGNYNSKLHDFGNDGVEVSVRIV